MNKKLIFQLQSLIVLSLVFLAGGFCLAAEVSGQELASSTEDLKPELIAEESEIINPAYFIYLDKATIAKGYTVTAFNDSLKLSLVPGILDEDTGVDVVNIQEEMEIPWQFNKISQVYQFEFRNKDAYDDHKPFYIQFSYEEESNDLKQVFFYDNNFNSWRPLPTTDYPEEKFVRSLIHLPFARIAVFSNPDIPAIGQASWYRYKGGDFAASPDFPKGSILRVYNTDYDIEDGLSPYVDVEVNDYGPDRGLHPDRVVDLDSVAFRKIASTRAGIINIKIEPLSVELDEEQGLGVPLSQLSSKPIITAKAGTVINEETGEEIFEKNSEEILPLASLTKIVAVYTFLQYNDDLDKVIAYKKQDEEYNYEHCKEWESAKLKLEEGDEVTVEDLIYSSLVGSKNNTVETLTRASGLTRADFIAAMNSQVAEWGATSTHFIEPSGLAPENVSSSKDYAIISKEVLKNFIIEKASVAPHYEFVTLNTEKEFKLFNTNNFIRYGGSSLKLNGSKTGYLDEAGYCLMMRAYSSEGSFIAVVFGADSKESAAEQAENLLKYSFKSL